jgi:hypothetical protein
MKKIYIPKKEHKSPPWQYFIGLSVFTFFLGCTITTSIILNRAVHWMDPHRQEFLRPLPPSSTVAAAEKALKLEHPSLRRALDSDTSHNQQTKDAPLSVQSVLKDLRILVVIVAFDFSQIPHLEEVLDTYHDVCVVGAQVDVVIHATIPYPVALIDLWNTRFNCAGYKVTIVLKPASLRLHLVDEHRTLFYEKIDEYDLFIYTEDDMRVSPTTIATYMYETRQIESMLQGQTDYKPSDFNVGVVRYEYNYPANVIIDDNTRHATQNVTRVYWEHSGFERPVVPNAVDRVPQAIMQDRYVYMHNHHQGMFLATRDLLKEWAVRGPDCRFNEIRDRPGRGAQPTQGTQRVWMSSHMLYGRTHCNVQQVIPVDKFGSLTIWHLPNKNYRRVGKYSHRKFADGSEVFERPHDSLLSAMELHIGLRRSFPNKPENPYNGITMVDEVTFSKDRTDMLERRMQAYQDYVRRGGVMNEQDMEKVNLLEEY